MLPLDINLKQLIKCKPVENANLLIYTEHAHREGICIAVSQGEPVVAKE